MLCTLLNVHCEFMCLYMYGWDGFGSCLNVYTASCDTMGVLNVVFAHTSLAGKLYVHMAN